MRTIESTPSEQRCLRVLQRITDEEWASTVTSVLKWLDSKPDTISEKRRVEMRDTISTSLSPTQICFVVIACYADIPPDYEWDVVFDIQIPQNHEATRAISCYGVYWKRAVMKQLDDGHHAAVVLDFPDGIPKIIGMLPTFDDGNQNVHGTIGFCTSNDYPDVARFLTKTSDRGITN